MADDYTIEHGDTGPVLIVDNGDVPMPPEFSDLSLALEFAKRHRGDLRFIAAWSRWYEWTGTKWQEENTLRAYDFARVICQEAAARYNGNRMKVAEQIASSKTVAAVEKVARANRMLAATVDQWDGDIWMLNTPEGTIDLKTGKMRPHNPVDYITASTAVAPSGECPLWMSVIDRATDGDVKLQGFMQRLFGYALTGSTREHALCFGYGTGANSKSVIIDTIAGIMGDYHKTAPIETFTASNSDRHPTDLAGLRGARLVTASETEEGRRWAESKIKTLTGGDRIAARFMRQDYFEYTPQFKLVIVGNHKPSLRNVDEAMRRRLHMIPFKVTIPPEERDPDLAEKLKAEWPGILAWMIDGCLAWQRDGLSPPDAVKDATEKYLRDEDIIAAWIEDKCEIAPDAFTLASDLFASWKKWAASADEYSMPKKQFKQKLEARGIEEHRRNYGRGFVGLRLLPEEPISPHWGDG